MVGVTRSVMGDEDASGGLRLLPVLQDLDPLLGHRARLAPELFHPLAVDAGRALYELRGIGKMRVADLVHVEGRVRQQPREVSRSARMIEVNVRKEDLPHVLTGD